MQRTLSRAGAALVTALLLLTAHVLVAVDRASAADPFTGYLMVHFTGEHANGGQIYFTHSKDGLHWTELNKLYVVDAQGNRSAQAGNSASYTFTGTDVQYVSMTQPNMGKVDVYLDGTLVQSDLDAYAPSVTKQVALFRGTDLPVGAHTIKVVCKGTKNPAANSAVCALDAFSSAGFAPNGYYQIVNRNSGLAVDVSFGSTSDGASKMIDVYRASTADNGYSKLRNANSGKVLAVSGSSTTAGERIVRVNQLRLKSDTAHWATAVQRCRDLLGLVAPSAKALVARNSCTRFNESPG